MKGMMYLMLMLTVVALSGGYGALQHARYNALALEVSKTESIKDRCLAAVADMEDVVEQRNERIFELQMQLAKMEELSEWETELQNANSARETYEEKYRATLGYRTRALLSKINPFDDNITE